MGKLNKRTFRAVTGGFRETTPDKLKKGEVGKYKNFKAGDPNDVLSEEEVVEAAGLPKGITGKRLTTLLGGGGARKVGL